MSSPAIETMVKMIEPLPETTQTQVVEHLREYLANIQDDIVWDKSFGKTQNQLAIAARRAKQEITDGLSEPLDIDRL